MSKLTHTMNDLSAAAQGSVNRKLARLFQTTELHCDKGPSHKTEVRYGDGQVVRPGDKVRLLNTVLHQEVAGVTGAVKRAIKSRNVVTVTLDNPTRIRKSLTTSYEAFPGNLERL